MEPLVDAAEFAVTSGATREQCWEALPEAVQARLRECSGALLAWSALQVSAPPEGGLRPQAAVLGRDGFAVAEPTVRASGGGYRPVFSLAHYRLDPTTLLDALIVHRPEQGAAGGSHARAGPSDVPPGEPVGPARLGGLRGVDPGTAGVIASMPPRAQELLVAPLAAHDEPVLRAHRFWQGSTPAFLEVVLVVLASARRVTAVSGRRLIPAGHDATTAHWTLTAWHGDVISRRGL